MTVIAEFGTADELIQGLQDGEVDKIWLFDCNNETDQKIRIVHISYRSPIIGVNVELVEYRRNLQKNFFKCLEQWAGEEHESCYEEQVASKILKKRELECKKPEKVIEFVNSLDFLSYILVKNTLVKHVPDNYYLVLTVKTVKLIV